MLFTTLTKITQAKKKKRLFKMDLGFPGGASGKESSCQHRSCKRHGLDPWVGEIPWSEIWNPTPVFLPGKFHRQRSQAGYSPRGRKRNDLDTKQHLLFQSKQFVFYTHPLLPPSPPTFNLSQHQGLFQ